MKNQINLSNTYEEIKQDFNIIKEYENTLFLNKINNNKINNYLNTIDKKSLIHAHIFHEYQKLENKTVGLGDIFMSSILEDSDIEIEDKDILTRSSAPKILGKCYNDVAEILNHFPAPLILKESISEDYKIEKISGSIFSSIKFRSMKYIEYDSFYPVFIDGYIESEEDIIHALEFSREKSKNVVIFCFSLSKEVELLIFSKYSLTNIVIIEFNENTLNIMSDLAEVNGERENLVSEKTGIRVSSAIFKTKECKSLSLSEGKIVFGESKASQIYLDHLISKIEKESQKEVADIYRERLKSIRSDYWLVLAKKEKMPTIAWAFFILTSKKKVFVKIKNKDEWYPGDIINLIRLRSDYVKDLIKRTKYEIVKCQD
jgi:hypothetical protein